MSEFVEFELNDDQLAEELKKLGYQVSKSREGNKIRKDTHLMSVINELVPIVEKAGINAWDLHLKEYNKGDARLVGEYSNGRIVSYN
ncbi:MAG: hypothetical protein ACOX47_08745 [Bacillota bacterium]